MKITTRDSTKIQPKLQRFYRTIQIHYFGFNLILDKDSISRVTNLVEDIQICCHHLNGCQVVTASQTRCCCCCFNCKWRWPTDDGQRMIYGYATLFRRYRYYYRYSEYLFLADYKLGYESCCCWLLYVVTVNFFMWRWPTNDWQRYWLRLFRRYYYRKHFNCKHIAFMHILGVFDIGMLHNSYSVIAWEAQVTTATREMRGQDFRMDKYQEHSE